MQCKIKVKVDHLAPSFFFSSILFVCILVTFTYVSLNSSVQRQTKKMKMYHLSYLSSIIKVRPYLSFLFSDGLCVIKITMIEIVAQTGLPVTMGELAKDPGENYTHTSGIQQFSTISEATKNRNNITNLITVAIIQGYTNNRPPSLAQWSAIQILFKIMVCLNYVQNK